MVRPFARPARLAGVTILAAVLAAPSLGAQGAHAHRATPAPAATIAAPATARLQVDAEGVAYGPSMKVGHGTARAYVLMAADRPMEVGVFLSESAMQGLQGHGEAGAFSMPDGHSMYEHLLPLPEGNPTGYRYVVLNWNPGGHEPPGIYDTPHFDFHFYTIADEARRRIVPTEPAYKAKTERLPAPELIPQGYVVPEVVAVPLMGVHWIDPESPELNGQPFTRTFIYGSWDGEVIFAEPMLTKAFLESKPDATFPLPFAKRYASAGWQPGSYTVRWEERAKQWRIALTQLTWKE